MEGNIGQKCDWIVPYCFVFGDAMNLLMSLWGPLKKENDPWFPGNGGPKDPKGNSAP